ncbi:MAG TPA: hypothetical protein VF240_03740 [Pyrinomonadaceae bacterium]
MIDESEIHELGEKIKSSVLITAEREPSNFEPETPFWVVRSDPLPPEIVRQYGLLPQTVTLQYRLDAGTAGMRLHFFMEGFAQEVIYECDGILDKFIAGTTVLDAEGESHNLSDVVSPALHKLLLETLTEHTVERFIYALGNKVEDAADELLGDCVLVALAAFLEECKEFSDLGFASFNTEFISAEYNRITKQAAAERKASLKGTLKYILSPNLDELEEHYRSVLPMWKDAKTLYKQNRNRETWRDIVRAAQPDLKDYDDLISRLSGRLNDLPENIQAKLSEKGGDSKPSSIALEHAARLCGSEPYEYSVRYLYIKLRKCRNGEQDAYS